MTPRFGPSDLDLLREEDEVEIETSGREGAVHRTVIWVVVDDGGRVFIRSVRGRVARWYREARARPAVSLVAAGRLIPVNAELAGDPERIDAASRALRAKYAGARASLLAMLRDETLETTLELVPR